MSTPSDEELAIKYKYLALEPQFRLVFNKTDKDKRGYLTRGQFDGLLDQYCDGFFNMMTVPLAKQLEKARTAPKEMPSDVPPEMLTRMQDSLESMLRPKDGLKDQIRQQAQQDTHIVVKDATKINFELFWHFYSLDKNLPHDMPQFFGFVDFVLKEAWGVDFEPTP